MTSWSTFDAFLQHERESSPTGRVVITKVLRDENTPWDLADPVARDKGRDARRQWLTERVTTLFPPVGEPTVQQLLMERLRTCRVEDLSVVMRALDADREWAFQTAETERHHLDKERARYEAEAEQARFKRRRLSGPALMRGRRAKKQRPSGPA